MRRRAGGREHVLPPPPAETSLFGRKRLLLISTEENRHSPWWKNTCKSWRELRQCKQRRCIKPAQYSWLRTWKVLIFVGAALLYHARIWLRSAAHGALLAVSNPSHQKSGLDGGGRAHSQHFQALLEGTSSFWATGHLLTFLIFSFYFLKENHSSQKSNFTRKQVLKDKKKNNNKSPKKHMFTVKVSTKWWDLTIRLLFLRYMQLGIMQLDFCSQEILKILSTYNRCQFDFI